MLANLELRNDATQAARAYLNANRFIEVETPDLTKSSPEGARDFLVPSRLQPHHFYALPQSPQMFKQILMVAGMDRYYQFARCFRDEDLRADRQPEHTQIDIEASFLTVPEIRELIEGLMTAVFEGAGQTPPATPLPRLSYDEAMLRYGSDKPDLRYGLEIVELSETFAASEFKVFRGAVDGGGVVRAIRAPGGGSLSRAQIDKLTELAKEHGAKGMAYVYVEEGRALRGPIVKFLAEAEQAALVEKVGGEPGDLVVFAADEALVAAEVLGQLRLALIGLLAPEPSTRWSLLWVEEFPLFEIDKETGALTYGHNPFSLPTEATMPLMESDPLAVRGAQYDLVLNGVELGSGFPPQPRRRRPARHPARPRHGRRAHRRRVRLVPRGARVRSPAARRHRPRLRPDHHAARRRRLHPRRHRLPQDIVGRRPHDWRAGHGLRRAAQGPARPARLKPLLRRRPQDFCRAADKIVESVDVC